MPNNKDNNPSGSKSSMGNKSDPKFEDPGKKEFGGGGQGHKSGSPRRETGAPGNLDDDDKTTSGGREGQFSDKDRDKEGQWSPGSSQSSDQ